MSHTFNTPAIQHSRSRIAVSAGTIVVGWTAPTATSFQAFVAERVGASWTGTYASPSATRLQFPEGGAPRNGKATAVIISFRSRLYATTET